MFHFFDADCLEALGFVNLVETVDREIGRVECVRSGFRRQIHSLQLVNRVIDVLADARIVARRHLTIKRSVWVFGQTN